jgi:DMATS type aromatic prenyltransferase
MTSVSLLAVDKFPEFSKDWRRKFSSFQPIDKNAAFWSKSTGQYLAKLLQEAGYDFYSQYLALRFHYVSIIPHLGPPPTTDGHPASWKSFMTDDFSPLEYSWTWDGASPKVRYSIEAIGSNPGMPEDPFNQEATLRLVRDLKLQYSHLDWQWFHHFFAHLCETEAHVFQQQKVDSTQSDQSSVFLAFELERAGSFAAKAYFIPVEAIQNGKSLWTAICTSIKKLELTGHFFPALDRLIEFVTSHPEGAMLEVVGLAVDCVKPEHSRLKLYVRSHSTSFKSIRTVMTLDHHPQSPITGNNIKTLRRLWHLVLGLDEGTSESKTLPRTFHQTSGVLYNFDIHRGKNIPEPKVYIPVKHHGRNDEDIALGLRSFLKEQGRTEFAGNYLRMLSCLGSHRSLSDSRGLQTYISCGFKKGLPSVTSYIGPEIYERMRKED